MTSEDCARIEQELSIALPPAYCEALQRPEFQGEAAGFEEFSGDADEIIGLNLEIRAAGFYGVKWPQHYLVIGEDGAGNNYFTDLKKLRPAVSLADHELTNKNRLVTSETYETFADFIGFIHRLHAEAEAAVETEDPVEAEQRKKPWWRFW